VPPPPPSWDPQQGEAGQSSFVDTKEADQVIQPKTQVDLLDDIKQVQGYVKEDQDELHDLD
jgi:hypothetical protein